MNGWFSQVLLGLTSFVIGAFLKSSGYVVNAVQTEKALPHIEICFIWILIVLCAAIAALTDFYKLDGIRGEMTEALEAVRCEPVSE
ncbi:MAG: hypothetical protein LUC47_01345 [Clostridiales bacterium]|nr:hypothetical protein [Clostridiales bacterium]